MKKLWFARFSLIFGMVYSVPAAQALTVTADRLSDGSFQIRMEMISSDLQMETLETQQRKFTRLKMTDPSEQALYSREPGHPEIPVLRRQLAITEGSHYSLEVQLGQPEIHRDVQLYPVQRDHLENESEPPFQNSISMGKKWAAAQAARILSPARMGDVSLLPIEISPIRYHAASRTLVIYKKMEILLKANASNPKSNLAPRGLNAFERNQLHFLALNGKEETSFNKEARSSALIVTSPELAASAKAFAELHPEVSISTLVLKPGESTAEIKKNVTSTFEKEHIETLILYGDETQVPVYKWSGIPSDSYLSYVSGDDFYSDLSVGRVPVANEKEAKFFNERIQRYLELQGKGVSTKKIMLVAHAEQYPGKYTANMETVRKSPNPNGYEFNLQYGGAGATNSAVIEEAPKYYGLINYRGHGSETAWYSWDKKSTDFSKTDALKLQNLDDRLSVFFNIACDTGAFQNSAKSFSEQLLLLPAIDGKHRGAVSVLASTEPSLTLVNDRFDINLFSYLQKAKSISELNLGKWIAAANNKLIADDSGKLNINVQMYVLLGDPLLSPWLR